MIGKNKKQTPLKMGGDRFIPVRNSKQMDVASFLLTKENEPADAINNTALSLVSHVYITCVGYAEEIANTSKNIVCVLYKYKALCFFHKGNPKGLVYIAQWIQHR